MIFITIKASRLLARPWGADYRYLYISLAERGNVISVIV